MRLLLIASLLVGSTGCFITKGLFGKKEEGQPFEYPEGPPIDCGDLQPSSGWEYIGLPYTGEEFIFDDEGYLVTVSDFEQTVVRMSYDGDVDVIAAFSSDELAGVDFLIDGDLVFADEANASLIRMSMEGAEDLIAGGLESPNSLTVDDHGFIYTTAYDAIVRVQPTSGDKDTIVWGTGYDLDGLTLSVDQRYLWFNEDETGDIYRIRIDAPPGEYEPEHMAEIPLNGHELDGMTTDACGNVYVVRTDGYIGRVRPNGNVKVFETLTGREMYTTSLHFGSGFGGWDNTHLYVMDRYGGVFDLEVGLPGAAEPHLH